MSLSPYSLDALVDSIKRRGAIPRAQGTFTPDDFAEITNDELLTYILPILQARREDYYLAEKIVNVSTPDSTIGIYPAWRIPPEALASTLRDVQGVDGSGAYYSIGRIAPDDLPNLTSQGFFIYGEYVVLAYRSNTSPTPTQLRLIYHKRPNKIVYEEDAFYVTGTAQNGNDIEIDAVGISAPSTTTINAVIDNTRGFPGFECSLSRVPASIDRTQGSQDYVITITNGWASYNNKIDPGDFIALSGKSPIPQIPLELHPLLAQRVAVKFLEAQGEQEQLAAAIKLMEEMESKIPLLIQPRVEGKPRKLVPRFNLWRRWRW